eukprot:1182772-Prorocentrum_minimum.AAC.1
MRLVHPPPARHPRSGPAVVMRRSASTTGRSHSHCFPGLPHDLSCRLCPFSALLLWPPTVCLPHPPLGARRTTTQTPLRR